jgi:NADPH:quinone reductase-like Zn-dependent oxidoreductase
LLASLAQFPTQDPAVNHGVRGAFVNAELVDTQTLSEIGRMIDGGQLRPVVSTIYPLADIRKAHEQSESRHANSLKEF